MPRQRRFDHRRHDRQSAGADGVVGPAEHRQPAGCVERADVVGAEPPGFGEGVGLRRVAVPPGQGGAADHDAPAARWVRPVDADLHPVQWQAVVHATAGGLAGAIGAHHGDAGLGCGVQHRPGRRSTAEQDGVEFGQGCGSCRNGQRLGQLIGNQRRVAPAGAEFADGSWQFIDVKTVGEVHADRHGAREDAAHQYLHSGDVVRR